MEVADDRLAKAQAVQQDMFRGVSGMPVIPAGMSEPILGFAFGDIWSREQLDRRARSCVTVALLIALNRPDELAIHFQVAQNNGLSAEELREICLHAAGYAGIPAAVDAFRVFAEVGGSASLDGV